MCDVPLDIVRERLKTDEGASSMAIKPDEFLNSFASDAYDAFKNLEEQKDNAYHERDMCISLIAKMAIVIGLNAGIGRHEESDKSWENQWMNIVFIDLPSGQVSWHIHDSELSMFSFLPQYSSKWDGHNSAVKYQRCLEPNLSDDLAEAYWKKLSDSGK